VLTGANGDGAKGLRTIKSHGGLAIVQNPQSAQAVTMPSAALQATSVDYVVHLEQIAPLLIQLTALQEEVYGTDG
jgi:two-component system, chemotaxis family, protein-glutamate methylesterase/glutaminase